MAIYSAAELIRHKRDGGIFTKDQVYWIIQAFTNGLLADEQMSALAMAIFFQDLTDEELSWWTSAMIATGERLDFSRLSRPTADKHSTGGVGDKITLPLVPLVAACGVAVPQLSGRGLGHTGGTLDKLESIPGWQAMLSNEQMLTQLTQIGGVICGAGSGLVPADKRLYALRDVTGTVESTALISSSIMSKKIAEGTGTLVLDVKVGTGAFMKELPLAQRLAHRMVGLGKNAGVNTIALLTDMNTPLGNSAGNAIEVAEAVEVLAGGGPADVVELTLTLAREMLAGARVDADPAEILASGKAMDVWRAMIRAQHGDPDAPLPKAKHNEIVTVNSSGYLSCLDAMPVAIAAWRLGAGRTKQGDAVQAAAGVQILAKEGEFVHKGQPIFNLLTDDESLIPAGLAALKDSYQLSVEIPSPRPLIIDRID